MIYRKIFYRIIVLKLLIGLDSAYEYTMYSVKGYDEESQKNYTQLQFEIVINGTYIFKIENLITEEITYQTFNVTNKGIDNQYGDDVYYDNYNDDGEFDPTPVLFLEYIDATTVRIRTQPFIFNEYIMLQCYFSSNGEDFEQIYNTYQSSLTFTTGHSTGGWSGGGRTDGLGRPSGGWSGGGRSEGESSDDLGSSTIDTYYFYQDVVISGTYYFRFYNIELDKYTTASIDVDINQFISDNIDNIDTFSNKMVAWSKLHFGFLTYPFELVVNFFNKIVNIDYEEPVLNIPELKEPFSNTVLLSATTFNFNNVLDINPIVKTIYNIYLVVVDVILIYMFVNLCKKVYEEVFK